MADATFMFLLAGAINMSGTSGSTELPDFPTEAPHKNERDTWTEAVLNILALSELLAVAQRVVPASLLSVAVPADQTVWGGELTVTQEPDLIKRTRHNSARVDKITNEVLRASQYEAGKQALSSRLAAMLFKSLKTNAPYVLQDLKLRHVTHSAPRGAAVYDGVAMFEELRRNPDVEGPTRTRSEYFHTKEFEKLRDESLPDGTTMEEYAAKCMRLLSDHIPHLPKHIVMEGEALSAIYMDFLPKICASEARSAKRQLVAAGKWGNPMEVLRAMKDVAEYFADESRANARMVAMLQPESRRAEALALAMAPITLTRKAEAAALAASVLSQSGKPSYVPPARGAPGKGAAAAKQANRYLAPGTWCSKNSCNNKHDEKGLPCFFDPDWAGPLPYSVTQKPEYLKKILEGRVKAGTRLQKKVKVLLEPVKPTAAAALVPTEEGYDEMPGRQDSDIFGYHGAYVINPVLAAERAQDWRETFSLDVCAECFDLLDDLEDDHAGSDACMLAEAEQERQREAAQAEVMRDEAERAAELRQAEDRRRAAAAASAADEHAGRIEALAAATRADQRRQELSKRARIAAQAEEQRADVQYREQLRAAEQVELHASRRAATEAPEALRAAELRATQRAAAEVPEVRETQCPPAESLPHSPPAEPLPPVQWFAVVGGGEEGIHRVPLARKAVLQAAHGTELVIGPTSAEGARDALVDAQRARQAAVWRAKPPAMMRKMEYIDLRAEVATLTPTGGIGAIRSLAARAFSPENDPCPVPLEFGFEGRTVQNIIYELRCHVGLEIPAEWGVGAMMSADDFTSRAAGPYSHSALTSRAGLRGRAEPDSMLAPGVHSQLLITPQQCNALFASTAVILAVVVVMLATCAPLVTIACASFVVSPLRFASALSHTALGPPSTVNVLINQFRLVEGATAIAYSLILWLVVLCGTLYLLPTTVVVGGLYRSGSRFGRAALALARAVPRRIVTWVAAGGVSFVGLVMLLSICGIGGAAATHVGVHRVHRALETLPLPAAVRDTVQHVARTQHNLSFAPGAIFMPRADMSDLAHALDLPVRDSSPAVTACAATPPALSCARLTIADSGAGVDAGDGSNGRPGSRRPNTLAVSTANGVVAPAEKYEMVLSARCRNGAVRSVVRPDALIMPNCAHTLISVGRLAAEQGMGFWIGKYNEECYLRPT